LTQLPSVRVSPSVSLWALFAASGISLIGNQLTAVVLPWLVLTSLGTAFDAGLVGAGVVLPGVIGAIAGGVITDRLGSRETSVLADVASAVAVAAIPVVAITTGLSVPLLALLAFAGALLDAPGATARQVLVPDLADRAGMTRERANGLFQSIDNASLLIGPLLAGMAILVLGPINALWLDAGTFVVSAVLVATLVPRVRAAPSGEEIGDILAGIRALGRDHVLRGLSLAAMVANAVGTPAFLVLLPALAVGVGTDAGALGFMLAAFGGGLVAGSLSAARLSARLGRRRLLALAFAGTGAGLLLVATGPPLLVMVAVLALAGVASGPVNPIAFTVMQERVPAAIRGRVFGAVLGGVLVAAPVGMIGFGALAEVRGPEIGLAVGGAAFVTVGLYIGLWRSFRELDDAPQPGRPQCSSG
jgi:predicted MFS family arabinose efflux permease